jgi:hypothetical protein
MLILKNLANPLSYGAGLIGHPPFSWAKCAKKFIISSISMLT